jgi:hypothetical protein
MEKNKAGKENKEPRGKVATWNGVVRTGLFEITFHSSWWESEPGRYLGRNAPEEEVPECSWQDKIGAEVGCTSQCEQVRGQQEVNTDSSQGACDLWKHLGSYPNETLNTHTHTYTLKYRWIKIDENWVSTEIW